MNNQEVEQSTATPVALCGTLSEDRAFERGELKRIVRQVRREIVSVKRELETRIQRLDELTNQITSLVE